MAIESLRIVQGASTYVLKTTQASGEISGGGLAMTEFKVGDFIVPVTADGSMLIYATPMIADSFLSAARIFDDPVESLAPLIEGHLVFIGASASGLRDIRTSTLGESVPGVYMHAQIADQILSGEFLVRPDWATGAEIALMITLGALTVLILPLVGAIASAAFGATAAVAVLGGSWIAFSQYGLLIDPIFPMATGGAIFLLTTILLFAFAEREKRFVRGAFQRYLAPDLLGKLEQNPDLLKLGGEIREMTLLFMDVRGFTPISEKLSPEELVAFLNELLSPLSEIILKHEGAIDKYIGDSIMAFWNAPLDVDDHPKKALTAALAMIEEVERLNREDAFGFKRSSVDLDEVKIGIGINTGESCVGNMGSSRRFDYSVIGDTVNIAARIESSCKAVGWPLLVSADTASACPEFAMLEAGAIPLKGKSEPITLFAVIGDEAFANQDSWRALKENHQKFMEAVARADAQAARDQMAACLKTTPVDLTEFYEIHLASAETEVAAQ